MRVVHMVDAAEAVVGDRSTKLEMPVMSPRVGEVGDARSFQGDAVESAVLAVVA